MNGTEHAEGTTMTTEAAQARLQEMAQELEEIVRNTGQGFACVECFVVEDVSNRYARIGHFDAEYNVSYALNRTYDSNEWKDTKICSSEKA